MLLAAAGLGVPGSFAQGTNGKAAGTKKPAASGNSAKSSSSKSANGKNASGKPSTAKPSAAAKAPAAHKTAPAGGSAGKTSQTSSKGTATHGTGKKATAASKRSRRQPGQKAPTSDRITEIQSALSRDGSFGGTPNGKWDDSTTNAMRKFQSTHGLNPTGKLDAPTLMKLGLGSQTAGVAAPTPPPGAVSRLSSSNSFPSLGDSTHQ